MNKLTKLWGLSSERMRKAAWFLLIVSAWIAPQPSYAYDLSDPFDTLDGVSTTPAKDALPIAGEPCQSDGPPPSPLMLLDAVERALCHNPQTRLAWANVKIQAAALGTGWSAYLPTVTARGNYGKKKSRTTFTENAEFDTDVSSRELTGSLNLNWVLYDFGLRAANLDSARQLLNAANASQNDVLQTAFLNTAQAFYEAQAAQALLVANSDAEQAAEKNFKVAEAKYTAGAGTLADKLQAQTSYAQATSKRVQSEGDLLSAMGSLAILMGLRPDAPLPLTSIPEDPIEDPLFQQAVDSLIRQAVRDHPKILAAQSQMKAAQAKINATRAEGLPKFSLIAADEYFNASATPINNQGSSGQAVNTQRIGLQVDIPLFEGFGRHYKIREAQAQTESKEAELANVEQQVTLEVWKSYQALRTGMENLKASNVLILSAKQSFEVAQGRYKFGVVNILELLKA